MKIDNIYMHKRILEGVIDSAIGTCQEKFLVTKVGRNGQLESFSFSLPDTVDFSFENQKILRDCLEDYFTRIENGET